MTLQSVSGPVGNNSHPVVIATHDGVFHADDVLAVATLTLALLDVTVVRTRDPSRLDAADIVVDVGGVYDPAKGRFDHHQRGRAGARENGILYSSFGLVWRHHGADVCRALGVPDHLLAGVSDAVDTDLVQPIDATDNGQNLFEGGKAVFEGVSPVSVSSVLSGFNPSWHEPEKNFDAAFDRAVEFAKAILRNAVDAALGAELAKADVRDAVIRAANGPIVVLDRFVPWGDQVRDEAPHALFVVFPSETGTWMCQAINAKPGTFESRRLLPESWAGLRDAEFSAAVGVDDGVFCHPGRFICGAKSRGSAIHLAKAALR